MPVPFKLAIRNDGAIAYAYFASEMEPDRILLGTLNLAVAELEPEIGVRWKQAMLEAFKAIMKMGGALPSDVQFEERRPADGSNN